MNLQSFEKAKRVKLFLAKNGTCREGYNALRPQRILWSWKVNLLKLTALFKIMHNLELQLKHILNSVMNAS